jgi:hypothetical protein
MMSPRMVLPGVVTARAVALPSVRGPSRITPGRAFETSGSVFTRAPGCV